MAKSTEILLEVFDLSKALNGAILAFSNDATINENGSVSGTVSEYVFNFKDTNSPIAASRFKAVAGGKTYSFDAHGNCSDGKYYHNLFIVSAEIKETIGDVATKGDSIGNTVKIVSLNPREQFAAAALTGLLHNIPNPMELDPAKISIISTVAFNIAQSMINTAGDVRAETSEGEPSEEIDINPNDISSIGDKILYNLTEQFKRLNDYIDKIKTENLEIDTESMRTIKDEIVTIDTSVSNIYETLSANAGVVKRVDIAGVSVSSVPTHITNTPIEVSGEVSVNNLPGQ